MFSLLSGESIMKLLEKIASTLPVAEVERVCVGIHWTAIVVMVDGERQCGLASTLGDRRHHGEPDVPFAGNLDSFASHELTALARSDKPILRSVGVAAINAILKPYLGPWVELNAEDVLSIYGAGKRVVLVGHFPFVSRLKKKVGDLVVLELDSCAGDLSTDSTEDVLPEAEVVALTAMTLINKTFEDLMALIPTTALIVLVGPSTPLSPILFDHGVDLLCGSVVTDIDAVLQVVGQGANFRQVHQAGVRLVTMGRTGTRTSKTARELHMEEILPI
jgi:uncharacterized protein (DUF4213/DUF364 family)